MTQKMALEELYRHHHERGDRYGYLYCDGARIPYLKKWIGQNKRVLDLGCRDGMLTQGYRPGNEIIGVDIDQKALRIIQENLGIETLWLDLNSEWPFQANSFDVIVSCEILEHLYFLEGFLKRVVTTLKPGGCFIGSVPNAFRMRNRMKFLLGQEFENDPTHVRIFSHQKLEKVLRSFFSNVEIIPLQGMILPCLSVSPSMPNALNRLFAKDLLWRAW
ncbi:MAG: class I SAM-dependent methyltransferase [Chlamydiota bacterium]